MTLWERGQVQVYTGTGKGKTTAAVGLAIRAAGRGARVCVLQFMKGIAYGEVGVLLQVLPAIRVELLGSERYVPRDNPDPRDVALASSGMSLAEELLKSGSYDLLVLDELNVAIDFGLIPSERLLAALELRSPGVEVVITGRGAPQILLAAADLVTEMVEQKHYYQTGLPARTGIEN